jgi:3-phosphoshikimate 1-carboxyvinyltransferase
VKALIRPHAFGGEVRVPASKSHSIRRLVLAALCREESSIENILESQDTSSCAAACTILRDIYTGASPGPAAQSSPRIIDVGNSGTTLFFGIAAAALLPVPVTFDGDEQIRRRSAAPLLEALRGLGVRAESRKDGGRETGCAPITVYGGTWRSSRVSLECPTSQYLSALLIAAPLAPALTEIDVPLLNERPYIEMTLSYLKNKKIDYDGEFSYFRITGHELYAPVHGPVPGDFSSAAFPAAAAVISGGGLDGDCGAGGGGLALQGLDPGDSQGDKVFFDYLEQMGCEVAWDDASAGSPPRLNVRRRGPLKGGTFDLNDTPDMLPVMAALGAFAEGDTALVNAAHARIKETDRIAVMAAELSKLGVRCEERPDGLVVHGGLGKGEAAVGAADRSADGCGGAVELDGHGDHRVVMALACAALGMGRPVVIEGAEAASVTYPGFLELIGAEVV